MPRSRALYVYARGRRRREGAAQRAEDVITLAGQVRSARLADDVQVLLRVVPSGDGADEDARDLRHRLSTVLAEMT